MLGFLKSLILDNKPAPPKAAKAKAEPKAEPKAAAPRPAAAPGARPMTAERADLIREAQRVRRAKQQILDHLSDEDRAKLVAMAMSAFLGQAPARGADREREG